jgi:hypothetical protein
MSKNTTPDPSAAEDYLSQLHWKSKNAYRGYMPWYLIPKWKYKPIIRKDYSKLTFSNIFIFGLLIIIIGYLIYSSVVYRSGLAAFGLIFAVIALIVLFLAARDVQKNSNDDNDQNTGS